MASLTDVVTQGLARIGGARPVGPSAPAAPETAAAPAPSTQKVAQAGVTVTLSPEGRQAISRMEGFVATLGAARKSSSPAQKPGSTLDISI